jgi:hypothetical protein
MHIIIGAQDREKYLGSLGFPECPQQTSIVHGVRVVVMPSMYVNKYGLSSGII